MSCLARLWDDPEWRSSQHASEISGALMVALTDDDAATRFFAAEAAPLLGGEAESSIELIKGRLLAERQPDVAAVLARQLFRFRNSYHAKIDDVLGEIVASNHWTALVQTKSDGTRAHAVAAVAELALYIAIRWRTPVATALVADWFRHPIDSDAASHAISAIRPWLALPDERADERARAFALTRLAALVRNELRATDPEQSSFRHVHRRTGSIVADIYYASGAHTSTTNLAHEATSGFAEEAFETLALLTEFRTPRSFTTR
ncbi:hypothetical protein [Lentzea sp. NPDC003310]|uniref:hypothetical protein n=1 Tax=Lentzea sp. NPDC003310 TaxID=3154447 RepID=UPI0033A5E287